MFFDFYLPLKKLLIEYDGEQHFKIAFNNKEKLKNTIIRDNLKNDFIKKSNYRLLRISYKNKKDLDKILKDLFIKKEKIISVAKRYDLYYITKNNTVLNENTYYKPRI